jgi:hypothetical protein
MANQDEHPHTEMVSDEEEEVACTKNHVEELDAPTKVIMSVFATIRSRIDDLIRAESDLKRFELSIEQERKRLSKTLENAKVGLRNARVQMAAELEKADSAGFAKAAALVKEAHGA